MLWRCLLCWAPRRLASLGVLGAAALAACSSSTRESTSASSLSTPDEPPEALVELASPPDDEAVIAEAAASALAAPTEAPQGPPPGDGKPRIGSIKWYTYIWEEPQRPRGTMAIGRLRIGTSVALKSKEPVKGGNCAGKWYAIEPRGYICTDDTSTFDLDSVYFRAMASAAPKPGPYPYRYAFSTGAPMYSRIPTPHEQEQAELVYGPKNTFSPLGKWSEGHEWLVDKAARIEATDEVPWFYKDNEPLPGSPWHPHLPKVQTIPAGSGFAYAKAFKHSGRVWLLTPEMFLIPADRVFPYKISDFHGVELGKGVELPLAWVRSHEGHKKHRRRPDGSFAEATEGWKKHDHVQLTGLTEKVGDVVFHQTREADDLWLAETPAVSVVRRVDKPHRALGADEKWIEARLMPGTMTAYVGNRPVWTTMWSGGKGGVPVPGNNPVKFATTELGLFPFQWKDKVATMSPDRGSPTVFWFADVPHIQYVKAPLAMHVAYWHDRFGHLMSAECLNISASDGEWLFNFTDPPLPPGWGAIRPSKGNGPSTRVHIKAW